YAVRFYRRIVRADAGDVHRPRRHPPRIPSPPHTADVADQRDLGDCRRRRDPARGRTGIENEHRARCDCRVRVDHEHRQRLPDHRSYAEDVQEARACEMIDQLIQLVYLVATALFIITLIWMSDPLTARRGVFAGVGGMALAIIGTLLHPLIIGYSWIAIPFVLGAL